MKTFYFSALLLPGIISLHASAQNFKYPDTRKVNQVDDYFGTRVEDPYRWLEDDHSPETAEWVKQENKITGDYLAAIPFRTKIKQRLTSLWNFPKQTAPVKKGPHYFFYANDGLQNQFTLNMFRGASTMPEVIIDPNQLSADGTTHLNGYEVSKDGNFLAYTISKAGSDWNEIHVMSIPDKKKLDDKIEWIKFSGMSFSGNGFYYSRYDAPDSANLLKGQNKFHKVFYHTIGNAVEKDELVYEDKNHPHRNFGGGTTEDGRYLIIYASEGSGGNELYMKDLRNPQSGFQNLCAGFDAHCSVIGNDSNWIYVHTNKDAASYKLIAVNANNFADTRVILPETKNVLQAVGIAGNFFVAQYMYDASSRLKVFNKQGMFQFDIPLPGIGTVEELSTDRDDENVYYSFTSFTRPATIYKFNLPTQGQRKVFKPALDFDADSYETKVVFYPSKDGTLIPMFITHRKGIPMNGSNPVLLFGYGGFNLSKTPEFKIERLVFLESGGILANPCLRGGGEYGESWHEAGTKLKKQNVFDDFIAAANYLIEQKYTNPQKLAIGGRSNGGLLVGACMMQRPELFKVALPVVGVMDMLRYHKFTIGWAWKGDYGSSEDETNFKNLYSYSPLHNIKPGMKYPATLVITGDHDDRVVPAHSFKFIATLQEKYKGPNPALIRVDVNSGHASASITGSSKPVAKQIDEQTDVFSFMMFNLGMTLHK